MCPSPRIQDTQGTRLSLFKHYGAWRLNATPWAVTKHPFLSLDPGTFVSISAVLLSWFINHFSERKCVTNGAALLMRPHDCGCVCVRRHVCVFVCLCLCCVVCKAFLYGNWLSILWQKCTNAFDWHMLNPSLCLWEATNWSVCVYVWVCGWQCMCANATDPKGMRLIFWGLPSSHGILHACASLFVILWSTCWV